MGLEEYGPEVAAPKPLAGARRRLQKAEKKGKPKKRRKKQPKAARVARTAKAREILASDRPVTITLTMPHWINGVAYGPGVVKVPRDMVAGFLENEQRVRENDANFMGHKAAYIGPANRAMRVAYEQFDNPMLQVMEAMTITKNS
jgi:hypothetical protein